MAFKRSEEIVYGINSAIIKMDGVFLYLEDINNSELIRVDNPLLMVDLLTIDELKRYVNLGSLSLPVRYEVENTLVRDKVIEVMGYKQEISILLSPAGIISTIAGLIFKKSYDYLTNKEVNYAFHLEDVNFIDQMCAIISYYTNTPYDVVKSLPVNEIFKRHATVATAFPNQVMSLVQPDPLDLVE